MPSVGPCQYRPYGETLGDLCRECLGQMGQRPQGVQLLEEPIPIRRRGFEGVLIGGHLASESLDD